MLRNRRAVALSDGAWWNLDNAIPRTNCVAAFQPIGASSLADSYTNIANPGTNTAAPGTAPTWDVANGWNFASASSQYLIVGSGAIITAYPITLVALCYVLNTTAGHALCSLGNTTNNNRVVLFAAGDATGDPITANANGNSAATTIAYPANTWIVAAGVFYSSTYRQSFLNGNYKGFASNTQAVTLNITYISARFNATLGQYVNGSIAACAFYNAALSESQIVELYRKMIIL